MKQEKRWSSREIFVSAVREKWAWQPAVTTHAKTAICQWLYTY